MSLALLIHVHKLTSSHYTAADGKVVCPHCQLKFESEDHLVECIITAASRVDNFLCPLCLKDDESSRRDQAQ